MPIARRLLHVLVGQATPSVATLGRWTHATAQRAGTLLAMLDQIARPDVRRVAADEIFVGRKPILMMIEPDSLYWAGGRLAARRDGENWAQEFGQLPKLEQVLRDGGTGMRKGVEQVNVQRTTQRRPRIREQLDHVHVQQEARRGLRRWRKKAAQAMDEAECAQKESGDAGPPWSEENGRGHGSQSLLAGGRSGQGSVVGGRSDLEAIGAGSGAVQGEGRLNTRESAAAVVAAVLPNLEGPEWAKTRRMLLRSELFTYLDRLNEQLAELPGDPAVKKAIARGSSTPATGAKQRGECLRGRGTRNLAGDGGDADRWRRGGPGSGARSTSDSTAHLAREQHVHCGCISRVTVD